MHAKPKLKSIYQAYSVPSQGLVLCGEPEHLVLEGRLYAQLAPFLDGEHSIANIIEEMKPFASSMQVFYALGQLEKCQLIVEGNFHPDRVGASYLERINAHTMDAHEKLAHFKIGVSAVGNIAAAPLIDALKNDGLVVDQNEPDFLVVVVDDYLQPELEQINRTALANNTPWMLFKPIGMEIWLGPILVPNETGCWECLAQRLSSNRQAERFVQEIEGSSKPLVTSKSSLAATQNLAASLAAKELVQWIVSPKSSTMVGQLHSLDLSEHSARKHVLCRRPQCEACGDPKSAANPFPPVFAPTKVVFSSDGGHRSRTPQQTYDKYEHHISPILGVTELIENKGPHSSLIPSVTGCHNFAWGARNLDFLRESLRGVSGGKGVSQIQAKVSGLCESIERYCGNYDGTEAFVRGRYSELAPKAIHPNECMGFSEEQYRLRAEPHPVAPDSRCIMVPHRFDENIPIEWTSFWSLVHEEERLLPSMYCYYGHPDFGKTLSVFPESNGTAAGNTLEEAFMQGFMELVERDAVAIWFYNRLTRPEVDLDSFETPYLDTIRSYYRSMNRDLWVIDCTSDLGIPCFTAISPRTDRQENQDIILGCGAHFDPKIALLRAVTEVNQFLPSLQHTDSSGKQRYLFGDALAVHWWRTATLDENPYLRPDPKAPKMHYKEITDLSSEDLLEDLNSAIGVLKSKGMDLLIHEQTRPDIGLSVVKVIAPGLNHFWRRFGKDRLWDVPVEQSWLQRRRTAEEINPYTVFF